MAWTAPFTAVAGVTFTAAMWNAGLRDDMLETMPAKATAAGQAFATTGPNAIAARVPTRAVIATAETTASTSLVDLTTPGPAITLTTGASAIYMISSFVQNATATQGGVISVAVSGATTIAANANRVLRVMSTTAGENSKLTYIGMFDGSLNAGSNTFTAKYAVPNSGTASFSTRELMVWPL